jgi:hypothetical protein
MNPKALDCPPNRVRLKDPTGQAVTRSLPGIGFTLFSVEDFEDAALASRVVSRILTVPRGLRPRRFGHFEDDTRKVGHGDVSPLVREWLAPLGGGAPTHREGSLLMLGSGGSGFQIGWQKSTEPSFSFVGGDLPLSWFDDRPSLGRAFVSLVRDLVGLVSPVYGEIRDLSLPGSDLPVDLFKRLPDIPWVSVYGRPYLDLFGLDSIQTAPFKSIEELPSGHYWLRASERVHETLSEEKKAAIRLHLGERAFMRRGRWRYKEGLAPQFDFSSVLLSAET